MTMTMGCTCKLYLNSGTFLTPTFTGGEVKQASGVKTPAERASSQKTGRGATYHTYDVSDIQDAKIELTLKHEAGNAHQATIQAAFHANTILYVAALDEAEDESGAAGPHGAYKVSKFTRNEPDEDTVEFEVELLPVDDTELEWLVVA